MILNGMTLKINCKTIYVFPLKTYAINASICHRFSQG